LPEWPSPSKKVIMAELVVRVRGTFIDIEPEVSPQKKRSCSAPPLKDGSVDEVLDVSSDSQYIAQWIGRARLLSDSHINTQHETFGGKCDNREKENQFARIVNKTVHPEKKNRKGTTLFGANSMPANKVIGTVIGSRNRWAEDSDFLDPSPKHSGWPGELAPDSKFKLEDHGPHQSRLNLDRSGPGKESTTRWLEENVLSKHTHDEIVADTKVTTLMICDIPCRQTVDQIIDAINHHGFTNTFDLVYMPSKRPKYSQNMGYAFVNFKTAEHAMEFGKVFQNFRFPSCLSKKLSYTKPARQQGYAENVNRYIKQRAVGCLVTFDDSVSGGQPQKLYQ